MIASIALFGLFIWLVMAVFGFLAFVFWIWMLIHAITNKGLDSTEKLIWVLVVLFLHFLGALLYFFIAKPKAV